MQRVRIKMGYKNGGGAMKKVICAVLSTVVLGAAIPLRTEGVKDLVVEDQQVGVPNEFNRLNWVDVSQSAYAIQLIFDFTQPIYFKKTLNAENLQLCLSFPGMHLQHFDKKQVMAKLSKLKQLGFVKKIDLFEQNENFPQVVLTIDFEKTRQINQVNHKPRTVKNSLLIKWCKLEDPNRLIFDIFTQETLQNLNAKDAIVLQACNNAPASRPNEESEKIRVVLDAGHGGSSVGAQCYGLNEKNLTLDIALRTRSLLRDNGMTALLTRNSDMDLSLNERTELANQLKAHLFVSIHINSGGAAGAGPCGLETYYLNTRELLPPTRIGGFLFVNLEKKLDYAAAVDKQLQDKTNLSCKLANTIQNNVISLLCTKNSSIINRGVKSEHFRIFFNNPTPTALVEVGFITNKKEAKLLAGAEYRQLIALGICKGITEYIASNKNSL